ncbi:MAG: hypothetical protein SGARI_002224 [Bacillariaceae sp.]
MVKQHDTKRRPSNGDCKPDTSDLASSTAPSTDESSIESGHVYDLNDVVSIGSQVYYTSDEEEEEEDYTHDMEQLNVALEFQCSMQEMMPDLEDYNSVGAAACDQSDDRTVDSLILTRRRFAKNRQEKVQKDKIPCIKMMNTLDGKEVAPFPATALDLKALLETRERLVKFTQDSERRRRVIKKHDSLELAKQRHPDLIHTKDCLSEAAVVAASASAAAEAISLEDYANRYLKKRIRPLMRTKDSLELARERLPHCIHTRASSEKEECIEDDDDLSLGEEEHHDCFDQEDLDELAYLDYDSDLDDDAEDWDSDFDPFEDDLDSILINKERMTKDKKKQSAPQEEHSNPKHPKDDHRRYKDMHYGRMGLCHTLLQSAGPNTGGANCAA